MNFPTFLRSLLETGQVRVDRPDGSDEQLVDEATKVLVDFERIHRDELPEPMPPLDIVPGLWAARWFYRCSQFLLYRDLPSTMISEALGENSPDHHVPGNCYSVDMTFRFLPDLYRLAISASETDPLTVRIQSECRNWGLSSVGIANLDGVEVQGVLNDRGLTTLYVDRIIETKDVARLSVPEVRDAVVAALGSQADQDPKWKELLRRNSVQESVE